MPTKRVEWPLVGRDRELAEIAAALDDSARGGVVVFGPAGVGKTRLATTALSAATARGHVTRSLRATPSASLIPFAALAPLFPGLDLAGETSGPAFHAAEAAISALGEGRRPIVMIDDAHALDDASAALVDQLVEAKKVAVLLTIRTGDAAAGVVAATVTGMWKDERVTRVDLAALDDDTMRRLLAAALPGPADGATVQTLLAASAGNALYLRELVLGALESGALTEANRVWRLTGPITGTARLRDLVHARLRGVSIDERAALELVALAEPVHLGFVQPIVGLAVVESLEHRGLVDVRDNGETALSHPLYGELLRAELSPLRRKRVYRSLADAYADQRSPAAVDRFRAAVWQLEGEGDLERGADRALAVDAGRRAFRTGEYGLAVRLTERAWAAAPDAEVGLLLGDALDYAGRHDDAESVLATAATLATSDHERAAIATRRASNLFRGLGRVDDADAVLTAAARTITDARERRSLDAVRANHFVLSGDVARALELTDALLQHPGEAAFAQASLDAGTAMALAGRTRDAIRHTEAALAARVDGEEEAQLSALGIYTVARAVALTEAGRLHEAAELAQGGYALSIELRNTDGHAWFATTLARVFTVEGRLGAALHLFRESATLFAGLGHPGQRWGLGGIALTAGQLGDRATAEWAINALDAQPPSPVQMMDGELARGRAWAAVARGELSIACEILRAAVVSVERAGQHAIRAALLHDLVRIDRDALAVDALIAMAGAVDGQLMEGRVAYAHAVRTGDPGGAAAAAITFEQCGANLFAAEARSLEAVTASERGLRRREAEARAGVARLLNACEGARTPALATVAITLSKREREVALLFASGLTSRQVAERLFLSARTVENHVQRVYTKLGVSNRDDLRAALDFGAN